MAKLDPDSSFKQVREIFLLALEQPEGDGRSAFIETATAGDPNLRMAVEKLLAHHYNDTFLEINCQAAPRQEAYSDEEIGQSIGRYKLLEKIGEGGGGTVYLAEQFEPVRRRVALKVIKLGMDTRNVVARFEAERQALALMDHPNIAQVLDGGATQKGRPYFVMELVRGVWITEYCQVNDLPVEDRLKLFIQLCHAIQHAHQKGVIHRDLKPSNVLVTSLDGKPAPKVIDFGIAKAIEEPLTQKTIFTNFHAFIGTPAYTSPEQAQMTGSDVDTRSDIYSLGVLLYEILTGTTPFDPKELTSSGLDEMRRIIKDVDPPLPSTRIRNRSGKEIANQTPNPLNKLDRDLDWIVMKCLEKDRSRRYSTAQELAADLERFLQHEPVLASPPGSAYRLKKAYKRHRGAFIAAAIILASLIGGIGISLRQAVRATKAERAAEAGQIRESLLRKKAELESSRALQNLDQAKLNEYIADINLAHQSILAGNLVRGKNLLKKYLTSPPVTDLPSSFEWRFLWKLSQGDEQQLFVKEASSIFSLAAHDHLLAVGMRDAIHVYDLRTGSLVKAISKSGVNLNFSANSLLASAGFRGLRMWDSSDWSETMFLPDLSRSFSLAKNGTLLAGMSSSGVKIIKNPSGERIAILKDALPPFGFSPDGKVIAGHSKDGLGLWSSTTGELIRIFQDSKQLPAHGIPDLPVLQFSPDGKWVVVARNSLHKETVFALEVWETSSGEHAATLPGARERVEHTGTVSGMAFSSDGSLLATGSWDHSVRLWDIEQKRSVEHLLGNVAEVWTVEFAPGDKAVISGAKDGTVRLWPVKQPRNESAVEEITFSIGFHDGSRYLLANRRDGSIGLYNLRTREFEQSLDFGEPKLPGLGLRALSRDGKVMAYSTGGHSVSILNLESKGKIDVRAELRKVETVTLSRDGAFLLCGSWGGPLQYWDLRKHSEPKEIQGLRGFFAEDGSSLVIITRNGFEVRSVEAAELKNSHTIEPPIHHTTALSPDGTILAAASNREDIENAIRLWDTRTAKLIGVCSGHIQSISSLAFSPDGKTLASSSSDSTLRLWNVRTQQQLLSFDQLDAPIGDLLFSPDGQYLIARKAGSAVSAVQIFEAPLESSSAKNTPLL